MATAALAPGRRLLAAADGMHVREDRSCGCCAAWIDILRQDEFNATTENSSGAPMTLAKAEVGIPRNMVSCHTGEIAGYAIEGHVPLADVRRLFADRPDAVGLAVPGMPYGSPGMGPEDAREAYDVHLIGRDGETTVVAHYAAAWPSGRFR